MEHDLYVEEETFFKGYINLFRNGRPENYGDRCPKLGKTRFHLNRGK